MSCACGTPGTVGCLTAGSIYGIELYVWIIILSVLSGVALPYVTIMDLYFENHFRPSSKDFQLASILRINSRDKECIVRVLASDFFCPFLNVTEFLEVLDLFCVLPLPSEFLGLLELSETAHSASLSIMQRIKVSCTFFPLNHNLNHCTFFHW